VADVSGWYESIVDLLPRYQLGSMETPVRIVVPLLMR
jgi:hypothetical protein